MSIWPSPEVLLYYNAVKNIVYRRSNRVYCNQNSTNFKANYFSPIHDFCFSKINPEPLKYL